jgi:hypothetical protein
VLSSHLFIFCSLSLTFAFPSGFSNEGFLDHTESFVDWENLLCLTASSSRICIHCGTLLATANHMDPNQLQEKLKTSKEETEMEFGEE